MRFELTGEDLNLIPEDVIGIGAINNDEPLAYLQAGTALSVISRTESSIEISQGVTISHGAPTYLGALVSSDRSIIYWVNNTRPLP